MNDFFKLILSLSLSGSVLILILLAVRPIIRRKFSQAWQYYIWMVVILRLLIPYSPEISFVGKLFDWAETMKAMQVIYVPATESVREVKENIRVKPSTYILDEDTSTQQPYRKNGDYSKSIWLIWVFGASLLFIMKVLYYIRFVRYIKVGASIVSDKEILEIFQQVGSELGIKRKVTLYQSALIKSPMLIGNIRPFIVIPKDCASFYNLHYVFRHEYIHFKRYDILYKWLVQMTVCMHWFNPLMYIMNRQINSLCELSCDEATSKGLNEAERIEYCNTIINAVTFDGTKIQSGFSMTFCEEKKHLKERLGTIMNGTSKSYKIILSSVLLLGILCCAAILLGAYNPIAQNTNTLEAHATGKSIVDELFSNRENQFIMPVEGRISVPFGNRVHPVFKTVRMHNGIDIGSKLGTPIKASIAGKVLKVTEDDISGKYVEIAGGNYKTIYAHCLSISVKEGQSVKQGEIIGEVGNTGVALGPHLHFEVWKDEKPINPLLNLPASAQGMDGANKPAFAGKIVIIDPGHGGKDKGAVYRVDNHVEINEKELNLKISLLLRDMLQKSGVHVELTRQADQFVTLEDRMKLAEHLNASLFISLHFDASPDGAKQGTVTMYNASNDPSVYKITGQKAAQLMQDEITGRLKTEDAEVLAMDRNKKYNNLKMPAMIIEPAFLSSASDRKIVMTKEFSDEAATAIQDGILAILKEM